MIRFGEFCVEIVQPTSSIPIGLPYPRYIAEDYLNDAKLELCKDRVRSMYWGEHNGWPGFVLLEDEPPIEERTQWHGHRVFHFCKGNSVQTRSYRISSGGWYSTLYECSLDEVFALRSAFVEGKTMVIALNDGDAAVSVKKDALVYRGGYTGKESSNELFLEERLLIRDFLSALLHVARELEQLTDPYVIKRQTPDPYNRNVSGAYSEEEYQEAILQSLNGSDLDVRQYYNSMPYGV